MVDEAIPVEVTRQNVYARRFTVANSPGVPIGTLMFLSGDNTASFAASGSGAFFLGINVTEKEAADGVTELTLDTGGVWDLTASGTIPRGHKVILAGGNRVQSVEVAAVTASGGNISFNAASGGLIVGTLTEAASDGEIVRVDVGRKA